MTAKTPEDELRTLVLAIDDGELGRPRRVAELRQLLANSLERITTLKRERDEAWRKGAEAMRARVASMDPFAGWEEVPLPTPEPEGE